MAQSFCEKCGAALRPGDAFCMACGAPIAAQAAGAPAAQLRCTRCGAVLAAGQAACSSCGAPVGADAPVPPAADAAGGYTPTIEMPEKKPGFFRRFFYRSPTTGKHSADDARGGAHADERPCPRCGASVKSWQRSCPQCGHVLDAIGNTGPTPGDAAGPYVPPAAGAHVAPAGDVADESVTSVLAADEADDYPTTVQVDDSMVYVIRSSTGARLDMRLPATMGKGSQASCLVTGNTAISRTHARITCDALGYQIEDLSSTNGTSVDGVAVPRGGFASLEDGMTFALADEEFTFHKVR